MKKFLKNCKGAVTVIVTLLLIPSILVSGTGVDLARIYVARSTLQDANQLALNSTLASYDTLLQDLYGLYGVMVDDPEPADMVDRYIRLTVFTEDSVDSTDTFQLFYGANLEPGDLEAVPNQNLGNPDVLRRQIEEYSKFQAPVIIINEILDRLDNFKQAKADADVIQDKLDIEDGLEELDELYKKIYDCINAVDRAGEDESSTLDVVNERLNRIRDELSYAYRARELYTQAYQSELEYLFHGDGKDAIANLKTVTCMIFWSVSFLTMWPLFQSKLSIAQ